MSDTSFSITSIESRIKQEWGIIRGFVALHPWYSVIISAMVGAGLMWLKLKVL